MKKHKKSTVPDLVAVVPEQIEYNQDKLLERADFNDEIDALQCSFKNTLELMTRRQALKLLEKSAFMPTEPKPEENFSCDELQKSKFSNAIDSECKYS